MFIEIRKTPQGKSEFEQTLLLPEELAQSGGVRVEVPSLIEIRRLDETLFVNLSYQGVVERVCDRCLDSFTISVMGSVDFVLQSKESEEDYSEGESDCYVYESEEDEIDFSQTLYDSMMLRLKYKSLCSNECVGLVENLPVEEEEKVEEETPLDPRWAALGKLKKK